jgi:hypothetical protein
MSESGGEASFSDLATRLVTSRQFRHRGPLGEAAPELAQPKPVAAGDAAAPAGAR